MGDSGRCMVSGCCYHAWDCKNIECCCKAANDCCCFRHSCCLSVSSKSRGCCCVGDSSRGECCKIACICCDFGLIWPTKICAGASSFLWMYDVSSLPCSPEYVEECVLAICYIQCCPHCGICAAPPSCPALEKIRADELVPVYQTMSR